MKTLDEQIYEIVDEFTTPGKAERYISELLDSIKKVVADYIQSIELPENRPEWNIDSKYQIIDDTLGNRAQELYEDMRLGYNQALTDCQAKLDEVVKSLKETK